MVERGRRPFTASSCALFRLMVLHCCVLQLLSLFLPAQTGKREYESRLRYFVNAISAGSFVLLSSAQRASPLLSAIRHRPFDKRGITVLGQSVFAARLLSCTGNSIVSSSSAPVFVANASFPRAACVAAVGL